MSTKLYLTFYADTSQQKNKLFKWRVPTLATARRRLPYFEAKGFVIRAAWCVNDDNSYVVRIR